MKKKLSATQIWVLELMQDGYELGQSSGFGKRVWLQKGGCGKGGDVKNISSSTLHAMINLKLINAKPGQGAFPNPRIYQLTEGAKAIGI